jgi:non-ribosomal peptide synthase protein (TIGR01720 family)
VHVTVRELTQADVENQAGSVIGTAIEDLQLYVLDSEMEPAPVGVAGELYVGGAGLARGYLNRPELTAEKFVPHPYSERAGERLYRTGDVGRWLSDGSVEYLGRKDEQVKIRGFRIELGEIEAALSRHAAVREAVVVPTTVNDDKRLVAYLVTDESLETSELRQYLKETLPEYMVPQAFVTLDQMPLTVNGKVDRKALPLPESNRLGSDRDYVAPRTPAEETLAKIWSTVLGVERVGIEDNFYELGGDSIISLQVVARANQAGLALSAKDLLQHQTISELTAVAGVHSEDQLTEQNTVTGVVPLTPIQHWYFEKHGIDPHQFNQYLMLRPQRALHLNLLEEALQHLIAHHDALRLRFAQSGTTWRQINAECEANQVVSRIDISRFTDADREASIREAVADDHARLNLSGGPLIRVLFFDSGAARTDRLLIVIHHLAVDAVSWRILLEDLDRVYTQLSRSEPVALGRKTHSFKQWAEQLQQHAESPNVQHDLSYWLDHLEVSPVRLDTSDGVNDVSSIGVISVKINREETRALRLQVPRAYRTRINEVLLTALLQAYEQWCGECRLLVDLEGHGREDELFGLDVSRTVGWFTSIFPLLLELDPMLSEGEVLQQVKEEVRRVPHNGVTYGMLRYLSGADISAQLQALAQPQISFNYLGELDDNLSTSEWFAVVNGRHGLNRSSKGTRHHVIEIDGWITGGQLRVNFTYSKNLHHGTNIKVLADNFIMSLRELIAHCQSSEEESFTPSDFPLAKLDQRTFSKVAALLNKEI